MTLQPGIAPRCVARSSPRREAATSAARMKSCKPNGAPAPRRPTHRCSWCHSHCRRAIGSLAIQANAAAACTGKSLRNRGKYVDAQAAPLHVGIRQLDLSLSIHASPSSHIPTQILVIAGVLSRKTTGVETTPATPLAESLHQQNPSPIAQAFRGRQGCCMSHDRRASSRPGSRGWQSVPRKSLA